MIGEIFFHRESGEIIILERWTPIHTWDAKVYDLKSRAKCLEGSKNGKVIEVRWKEIEPNERLKKYLEKL